MKQEHYSRNRRLNAAGVLYDNAPRRAIPTLVLSSLLARLYQPRPTADLGHKPVC